MSHHASSRVSPAFGEARSRFQAACHGHELGRRAFGVRVAGVSVECLESLRCVKASADIEQIVALDEWVESEAVGLADVLYQAIGSLGRPELKPRLVGLRREVISGRRPSSLERIRAAIPDEIAQRVERFARRQRERDALCARLPEQLQSDVENAAAALRETVSQPNILLGLVYSNAAVFEDARRWLAKPGSRPVDKKAVRLAKYVSRAAAKTSPLTLFTSSGLGTWRDGGAVLVLRRPEPSSVLELGLETLVRLIGDLAARPVVASRMLVRVNPTVALDGDVVRFVALGNVGSARALRLSPALGAILRALEVGCTLAAFRSALESKLPDAAQAARAMEFVDRLLRVGVLELHLPIPDQDLEARTLLAWLDEHGSEFAEDAAVAAVRASLRRLVGHLDGYSRLTSPEARLLCRERLEAEVAQLTTVRREPEATHGASAPVFFENSVVPGESLTADRSQWAAALEDLGAVARFAELFDPGLPAQLLLRRFVLERYGEGAKIPFLRFYAAYEAEVRGKHRPLSATVPAEELSSVRAMWRAFSSEALQEMEASPSAELASLGRLRRQAFALLRTAPEQHAQVLQIPASTLLQATAGCPGLSSPGDGSLACYVQPCLVDGRTRFVMNTVRFGLGTGRTRIQRLVRKTFGEVALPIEQPAEPRSLDGPIYMEVESAFGSALNQRDAGAEHVLSYPGTVSARPAEDRISLGELCVVHEPSTGRVRLEKSGRTVLPVHLGLLATALMPQVVQFLVCTFSRASYYFTPLMLAPLDAFSRRAEVGMSSEGARIRSWPRVDVGCVTIRRAGWWVPPQHVPRRTAEKDAAYLLKLARWRRELKIPERCFIRGFRGSWFAGSESGASTAEGMDEVLLSPWLSKERKPMYIDFASWHLVEVFERMFTGEEVHLMIEEVLPDFAHIPPTDSGERRVLELIVETPLGG